MSRICKGTIIALFPGSASSQHEISRCDNTFVAAFWLQLRAPSRSGLDAFNASGCRLDTRHKKFHCVHRYTIRRWRLFVQKQSPTEQHEANNFSLIYCSRQHCWVAAPPLSIIAVRRRKAKGPCRSCVALIFCPARDQPRSSRGVEIINS